MVPRADDIAMLVNPANPTTDSDVAEVKQSARAIGVNLHIRPASTPDEIDVMLNDLAARGIDGALVGDDPFLLSRREQIVASFTTQRIPAIYFAREFVLAGGLMSYGASLVSAYRQAGLYVGALLKGSGPSDLPVVQPTAIALTVNLRAARAIGLTVPVSVLVAADEVIE
jgi:putative tryptophan/tyrosine transport system substrate-binding protein